MSDSLRVILVTCYMLTAETLIKQQNSVKVDPPPPPPHCTSVSGVNVWLCGGSLTCAVCIDNMITCTVAAPRMQKHRNTTKLMTTSVDVV